MARKGSKKNAIDIEADMSEGYKALGFVSGMSSEVSTTRFIAPVVEYVHSRMAQAFDNEADIAAQGSDQGLSHVYEWRMVGLPQGRLWKHTLTGRGEDRQASWQWVASKAPILTPEERKASDNPYDPIKNVSDEDIAQLSDRKYIFYWKAPVLEYGMAVNIAPVYAKALWIPTADSERGFVFAKGSSNQMASYNQGKFTALWSTWWRTAAPKMWDMEIKRTIEKDLGQSERELAKATRGRARTKTFSLSTLSDNEKAYEAGRNYAEAYFKGKAKSYKQAAKYVDKYGRYEGINY